MKKAKITLVCLLLSSFLKAQLQISIEAKPNENVEFGIWDVVNRKAEKLVMSNADASGKFNFSGEHDAGIYELIVGKHKPIYLAIEQNEHPVITCSKEGCEVKNSPGTILFNEYHKFRKESLNRLVIHVRNKIRTARVKKDTALIAKLTIQENEQYLKHKTELTSFVKDKMGTSIAVWATSTRWNPETDLSTLEQIYIAFQKAHPNNSLTTLFKEKIERFKQIQPSSTAPDVELTDANGNVRKLSSLKGKVVLLEFWASWCGPCRRENPHLKKLYEKYSSKGFEIFGVSLDKREKSWKKAIEKDELPWINVSDLEGYKGLAPFQYSVSSIPTNFLLDKEGKIIAMNLFGQELERAIHFAMTK